MEPTAELLELCLLFFFASHTLEDLDTAVERARGRATAARPRPAEARREPW
jgi:alkanesulfonate monooxygenase SsuD/methylene tetrahydromethanopterin reductase-like flavin-dependent oxidoreductase (luciferase family)